MRLQYENRWKLCSVWCTDMKTQAAAQCLQFCSFKQSLLNDRRASSTLRVYIAAISYQHTRVSELTVGSHDLVSHFFEKRAEAVSPKI